LPVTTAVAGEIVSLPMFPQLTEEQAGRVIEHIRAFIPENDRLSSAA
jgi:dTDP-4-amino-4,6-dideoxygalactose transaminase